MVNNIISFKTEKIKREQKKRLELLIKKATEDESVNKALIQIYNQCSIDTTYIFEEVGFNQDYFNRLLRLYAKMLVDVMVAGLISGGRLNINQIHAFINSQLEKEKTAYINNTQYIPFFTDFKENL